MRACHSIPRGGRVVVCDGKGGGDGMDDIFLALDDAFSTIPLFRRRELPKITSTLRGGRCMVGPKASRPYCWKENLQVFSIKNQ